MRRIGLGRRVLFGALVAGTATSCSLLLPLDGFGPGDSTYPTDTGAEAGHPTIDALAEAEVADASAGDTSRLDDAGCPGERGPTMVRSDAFCIDSTEVTNAQYAAFLDSLPTLDGGPPACAWKSSYTPTGWPTSLTRLEFPVSFVDWCDAEAFCRWSGKRLCGLIGSGAALANTGQALDAKTSEWFAACTGNGKAAYPYGGAFEAGACNTGGTTTSAVGSFPRCEGGLHGLFDMSGNVWEWANWCDADAGQDDTCRDYGASYGSSGDKTGCAVASSGPRKTRNSGTGFRCCSAVLR